MSNSLDNSLNYFSKVRLQTMNLINHLNHEDMVVQSELFVSPIKWHLAHTTWFFENFILLQYDKNFQVYNEGFSYIFNSETKKLWHCLRCLPSRSDLADHSATLKRGHRHCHDFSSDPIQIKDIIKGSIIKESDTGKVYYKHNGEGWYKIEE